MQYPTAALETSEILRRDKRGRVWLKPERREALLDEFEKSGMSGAQFARLTGVKYSSFQNWVQRRRRAVGEALEAGGKASPVQGHPCPVRLFEAMVGGGDPAEGRSGLAASGVSGLWIELPGGSRMCVETPVQMRLAVEVVLMIAQSARARC